ncbi:MAG: fibrillarin-like rRNA/tRNA 2'-O-methyltransferase [Promethearchaeota archaeon]
MVNMSPFKGFEGVLSSRDGENVKLYTINLVPGVEPFPVETAYTPLGEARQWDPHHSKLAAALLTGLKEFPLRRDSRVLYLGAASGRTVTHVSDLVTDGVVMAVEFSPRALRELVQNCGMRHNVFPVLGDATKPQEYRWFVTRPFDVIYQDVAQPNQAEILVNNARWYLKKGGTCMLAIKARSVDSTADPNAIIRDQLQYLEGQGMVLRERLWLEPYSKDHAFVTCGFE